MRTTRRTFCDTRMGQVHCVLAGSDPRPPLVLLHQTPRSTDEFADAIPLLARERRVIAIDIPGYGCSDPVPGQPTVPGYAAAILDALDALREERFVAVGHHTGEILAVELAAAAPDRVERVALSGPIDLDPAGRANLLKFFRQWTVAPDGSHLIDKWRKFHEWLPRADLVQKIVLDLFRAGALSEQGHFATTTYAMEERLPLVRCAALLIYGARDPFATPATAAQHRAAFRPVTEITIDAGVFAPTENPQAYADAVLAWLRS